MRIRVIGFELRVRDPQGYQRECGFLIPQQHTLDIFDAPYNPAMIHGGRWMFPSTLHTEAGDIALDVMGASQPVSVYQTEGRSR